MPSFLIDMLFVLLITLTVGSIIYWSIVVFQILLTQKHIPTARSGIALAERTPPMGRVCVIVPCHNEAGNIDTLIHSLKNQDYDRLNVVLVLDRCQDDTLGVARDAIADDSRFEIIEVTHCPQEWAGKVHAAHCGFTQSSHAMQAELLLFTDADTWLDPSCIRASVALLRDRELQFLSLLSTLSSKTWFERLVQPVTAFQLARQFPLMRVNRNDRRRRAFANGQYMLFDANLYRKLGGHERVKSAILEDIAFAKAITHEGEPAGLFLADDMLRCRMYDSWDQYQQGWKRIYTESANREVNRLRRYAIRTPMFDIVLPISSTLLIPVSYYLGDPGTEWIGMAIGALALVLWVLGLFLLYSMSNAKLRDIPGAFIGAFFTGWIFYRAAIDLSKGTPTEWGGRSYTNSSKESS